MTVFLSDTIMTPIKGGDQVVCSGFQGLGMTVSSPLPIVACVHPPACVSASSGVCLSVLCCVCRCLGVVRGVQQCLGVRDDKQGLHTNPLIHAYFKVTTTQ